MDVHRRISTFNAHPYNLFFAHLCTTSGLNTVGNTLLNGGIDFDTFTFTYSRYGPPAPCKYDFHIVEGYVSNLISKGYENDPWYIKSEKVYNHVKTLYNRFRDEYAVANSSKSQISTPYINLLAGCMRSVNRVYLSAVEKLRSSKFRVTPSKANLDGVISVRKCIGDGKYTYLSVNDVIDIHSRQFRDDDEVYVDICMNGQINLDYVLMMLNQNGMTSNANDEYIDDDIKDAVNIGGEVMSSDDHSYISATKNDDIDIRKMVMDNSHDDPDDVHDVGYDDGDLQEFCDYQLLNKFQAVNMRYLNLAKLPVYKFGPYVYKIQKPPIIDTILMVQDKNYIRNLPKITEYYRDDDDMEDHPPYMKVLTEDVLMNVDNIMSGIPSKSILKRSMSDDHLSGHIRYPFDTNFIEPTNSSSSSDSDKYRAELGGIHIIEPCSSDLQLNTGDDCGSIVKTNSSVCSTLSRSSSYSNVSHNFGKIEPDPIKVTSAMFMPDNTFDDDVNVYAMNTASYIGDMYNEDSE